MAWTSIPASVYAVGKPITSVSYGYLKDNIEGHDHVAGRGATIGTDGVNRNSLKQAQGSVFLSSTSADNISTFTLPGGEYGFYPRTRYTGSSVGANVKNHEVYLLKVTTTSSNYDSGYVTHVTLRTQNPTSGTAYTYAQQRYIQASPPYKIGDKLWGHFLYMLINSQGDVVAAYEAEDPPYAYNGPSQHAKDSIERIAAVPHPFMDYWNKDPTVDGLEIVLVDLRGHDTKKWKADNAKQGRGILEDLGHINKGGQIVTPQELGIDNIQGFTDKVKIRKHN